MNETPLNVFIMEDPSISLTESSVAHPIIEKRTLHVSYSDENKLSYTIYSTNPDEEGEWSQHNQIDTAKISVFWNKLNEIFSEVITGVNNAIREGRSIQQEWDDIFIHLEGFGKQLFFELIPSSVAERVQTWQSGSYLRISTNETWIPWELIYDGLDFWGSRFILTRYPRMDNRRTIPNKNRPKNNGSRKIKQVINVIGGGLPETQSQRASKLFENLLPSEKVKILQAQSVSILAKALVGVDMLHCTCHGHLESQHMLQIAGDKSLLHNLCLEMVNALPLEPGSLVFANACSSNVPVQTVRGFSNFGWEFYTIGADVFIGTLGTIPAQYAVPFAENVYRELLGQSTVGEAVAKAKDIAAKDQNRLFSLLYCIYGDPNFSVTNSCIV